MNKVDFSLYLITDRHSLPPGKTLAGQIEAALRGGLKAVQLREKDLSPEELLPLAQQMRDLTSRYGARLLINSSVETALAVDADGVHLTSQSGNIAAIRKHLGEDALIGVSTHSLEEIEAATRDGADLVTFGPVYPTPSKMAFGAPLGLDALAQAGSDATIPVFALGGIHRGNLAGIVAAGCRRAAGIGAIQNTDDPAAATRDFLAILESKYS